MTRAGGKSERRLCRLCRRWPGAGEGESGPQGWPGVNMWHVGILSTKDRSGQVTGEEVSCGVQAEVEREAWRLGCVGQVDAGGPFGRLLQRNCV
jgi:hypothetical protein